MVETEAVLSFSGKHHSVQVLGGDISDLIHQQADCNFDVQNNAMLVLTTDLMPVGICNHAIMQKNT